MANYGLREPLHGDEPKAFGRAKRKIGPEKVELDKQGAMAGCGRCATVERI